MAIKRAHPLPEDFAWCGFDDSDVVIGDVDAEFEGSADDVRDGTWRDGGGRLHGAALGERRVEELLYSPRAASLFATGWACTGACHAL
ncbi:MAG: hypothetical protein QP780_09440 [Brevibacterium sp. UMB1308B]|nr:hypothetical protein [Brevibacterium sp. UMB1308B]